MSVFTTLVVTKVAAGLLAGGVVLTGAAAYADVLPASLQQAAHDTIGAPAPALATPTPVIAPVAPALPGEAVEAKATEAPEA